MRALIAIGAATLSLMVAGCIKTEPPISFPPIDSGISEVRVYATVGCDGPSQGSSDLCAVITDSTRIQGLVSFVNARPDGWTTPWAGAPIHPVRIEFRRGDEFDRYIGVGPSSIEPGTFLSRRVSDEEVDEILGLSGLDRSHLRFRSSDPD